MNKHLKVIRDSDKDNYAIITILDKEYLDDVSASIDELFPETIELFSVMSNTILFTELLIRKLTTDVITDENYEYKDNITYYFKVVFEDTEYLFNFRNIKDESIYDGIMYGETLTKYMD